MKQVLVISTSLRGNSNSDTLAEAFIQGAEAAGHQVKKISLKGKDLHFCQGCLSCQRTGHCIIHDDMESILESMKQADVIVFATPIYYYEMSGQMKVLLDRANPLYGGDYAFREVYLLATAADENRFALKNCEAGVLGWVTCFSNATLKGSVFAGGVTMPGDIEGHLALKEAYDMGTGI